MEAKMYRKCCIGLGVFFLALLLSACGVMGWPSLQKKQILAVRAGMSDQSVLAMLGEPQDRSIHQGQEEWAYYVASGMETMMYYIVFQQGKVVSLSRKSLEQKRREALGIDQRPPVVQPSPGYGGFPPESPPQGNYPGQGYTPQFEQGFEDFFRSVQREVFDSDKYKRLEAVVSYRPFTCAQAMRLMRLFTFSSERMKVIEILAPAIVDKQNAYKVRELFNFSSEQERAERLIIEKARNLLPDYSGGYGTHPYGLSRRELDADFEDFYRSLSAEPFESDKWRRITESARYRYYTCRHCIRVMQMFPFESDRTKVLELLAPAIIDPENAYQVADLYTFNSDKERVIRLITQPRRRAY